MDEDTFLDTMAAPAPPADLSLALQALWWDGKGDWQRAHACAQAQDDTGGAIVHAYLHRKEGDLDNARYWYHRAGREVAHGDLEVEWHALVQALLRDAPPRPIA
jgi:hypothetical protein